MPRRAGRVIATRKYFLLLATEQQNRSRTPGIADAQKGQTMSWLTSPQLNTLQDLFIEQLQDLYDAEQRLTKALPMMAAAAHDAGLKEAFQQHLRETQNQVKRLEKVFQLLNKKATSKTCEAMKGLVSEGEEAIDAKGDPEVKDAALIAAAQRVEHYEIAAYGTVRTFARRLGQREAARLLEETLNEEKMTDQKLTQLAESGINQQAMNA
jgi:ferritin-like metal-binding protein YciE